MTLEIERSTAKTAVSLGVFHNMPLNRAHFQERLAEKMLEQQEWGAAVACYQLASSYIAEAMKSASTKTSLQGLELQQESYMRQCKYVAIKQAEVTAAAGQVLPQKEQDTSPDRETPRPDDSEVRVFTTDDMVMDSLMPFHNKVKNENVASNQKKFPKSEQDIKEEKETRIENLESLVRDLMNQIDQLKDENLLLRQQLRQSTHEEKTVQDRVSSELITYDSFDDSSSSNFFSNTEVPPSSIMDLPPSYFVFEKIATKQSSDDGSRKNNGGAVRKVLTPLPEKTENESESLRYEDIEDP